MSHTPTDTLRAAFAGSVRSHSRARGALLVLSGRERGSAMPMKVAFSGTGLPQVPTELADVEIHAPGHAADMRASRTWQVRWTAGGVAISVAIAARALHVQRDAKAEFQRAIAPWRATLPARVGWSLLLHALRAPGSAWLMNKLRARRT